MTHDHLSLAECCALEVFKHYLGKTTLQDCVELSTATLFKVNLDIENKRKEHYPIGMK